MKVAFLTKKSFFEISEETIDKRLNDDEVLVKISGTGICGSDLHYFRHGALGSMKPNYPISLGHETAGIIIDNNKSKFKNYTNVIIDPLDISNCASDIDKEICNCGLMHNLCKNGSYLGAYPMQGSFREIMILKKNQLTILDKSIDPKTAPMIEPCGIAQYAIDKATINLEKDNNILILGAGGIGLILCSLLYKKGIKNITILDKNKYRLDAAKKTFYAKNIIYEDLKSKSNKDPKHHNFNYIFDFITTNASFEYGFKSISPAGKYIVIGIPEVDFIEINPHKARIKEIDIINIRRSNVKFHRMQKIILEQSIPIKKLVTHRFKLDEIQKAFNIASNYKNLIIRGVVG